MKERNSFVEAIWEKVQRQHDIKELLAVGSKVCIAAVNDALCREAFPPCNDDAETYVSASGNVKSCFSELQNLSGSHSLLQRLAADFIEACRNHTKLLPVFAKNLSTLYIRAGLPSSINCVYEALPEKHNGGFIWQSQNGARFLTRSHEHPMIAHLWLVGHRWAWDTNVGLSRAGAELSTGRRAWSGTFGFPFPKGGAGARAAVSRTRTPGS